MLNFIYLVQILFPLNTYIVGCVVRLVLVFLNKILTLKEICIFFWLYEICKILELTDLS
jgi:hypothetical protein